MFSGILKKKAGRYVVEALLIFSSIFLAIKSGLWLTEPPYYVSPIWFGSGVAVGMALLFGFRQFIAFFAGFFLGFYFHNYHSVELIVSPFSIALLMSVIGLLITFSKTFLIRIFIKEPQFLREPLVIVRFLVIMIAFSAVAFTLYWVFVKITNDIPFASGNLVVFAWAVSDLAGSLIFIPFILYLSFI